MRSLFGDQGAEVSLGVKTETNQESLSGERNGGTVPQYRISCECAVKFPFLQYCCTKQLGQNLIVFCCLLLGGWLVLCGVCLFACFLRKEEN